MQTTGANFNQFNQRMGNEMEANQQMETRTVYYRMPPNTSAPPSLMQQAPTMMGGMPPRGPPRFNMNNNNQGKRFIFDKNEILPNFEIFFDF